MALRVYTPADLPSHLRVRVEDAIRKADTRKRGNQPAAKLTVPGLEAKAKKPVRKTAAGERPGTYRSPFYDTGAPTYTLTYERRPFTMNAMAATAGNWQPKNKLVREWREAFRDLAVAAQVPYLGRVDIIATPHYPNNLVPDAGAVMPAIKAAVDGLHGRAVRVGSKDTERWWQGAGVIDDDCREFLPAGIRCAAPITDGGPARLVLTIVRLP